MTLIQTRTSLNSQVASRPGPGGYTVVDTLHGGRRLLSKNGQYAAFLGEDGVFSTRRVLRTPSRRNKLESVDIWRSHEKPKGVAPFKVLLTFEGNIEVVDSKNTLVWESRSSNRGVAPYRLVIQDDGNLVLKDFKKAVLWDSNSDNQRKIHSSKIGSTVLQTGEVKIIEDWLGSNATFELCYRASIHGRSSSEFHNRCDAKGSTITFIKTDSGFRFGAYTTLSWDTSGSYKGNDSRAFVFSMDKQAKYGVSNQSYVTYNQNSYGPTFGGGHDIHIRSDMKGGYVNPHSYRANGSASLQNGKSDFQASEVEVYVVKLK